jgi:hypothetical protein
MKIALALVLLSACIPMQPAGGGGGGGMGGGGGGGGGGGDNEPPPPPSGPVHVTIRSQCPNTVKVFYGDKPKFGSGTLSSISSNSVNSHTFQPGDMFWIVDESENGITSTTVDDRTDTIEINRDCASFTIR